MSKSKESQTPSVKPTVSEQDQQSMWGSDKWEEKRSEWLVKTIVEMGETEQNMNESQPTATGVTQILEEEDEEIMEKVKVKDKDIFMANRQGYTLYLKGVHILEQIIDGIEKEGLLQMQVQEYNEFMFLVALRSYNYLSTARQLLKKSKDTHVKKDLNDLMLFQTKAKSKFGSYSELLDQEQKKIKSKIKAIAQKFYVSEEKKRKYLFLDGFEGFDYTTEEQVAFTYNNYIQTVLNSPAIKDKYFVNHRLKKALRSYKLVCEIREKEVESIQQFEQLRDKIMLDQ